MFLALIADLYTKVSSLNTETVLLAIVDEIKEYTTLKIISKINGCTKVHTYSARNQDIKLQMINQRYLKYFAGFFFLSSYQVLF